MSVRVGVVGTGFGARVVAPVFAATTGCTVADVVSARDDAGVAALCERDDVDLVCVHSPPFLHAMHVRRALVGEKAVLCDKPFGRSGAEAETLLAAAEAAECVHLLNFEFRYEPMRELMRGLIMDGAIGRPEHVTWTQLSAGSRHPLRHHGWLFERDQGGGWIGAWGSHAVDALRWMLGEVVAARAECRTSITERPDRDGRLHACDAEDGFSAWLTLEGGVSVAIDSTFAAAVPAVPRILVTGSAGSVECVGDQRVVVRHVDGTREEHPRPPTDAGVDPHLVPMQRWAVVVRDAIEDGTAPPGAPTFSDGFACARVLDLLRGVARADARYDA
jgi:predicted dehydrogenase